MVLATLATIICLLSGPDNNIEWSGVSHLDYRDRRPLCPVSGESFQVLFQAYRFDITSARVRVYDGAETWVNASFAYDRGPYAVWQATVPATASTQLRYYIEITDGTDVDYLTPTGMSETAPGDGGWLLDYSNLSHAPVGATVATGGVVFKVWAPSRTAGYVRGEFNSWGLANPLTKLSDGHFVGFVAGAQDRQMYKYFFTPGDVWKPDARARSLNPSDNYNSHIQDPFSYTWTSGDFDVPEFRDLIIYEMHVGTFAGRNDPYGSAPIPSTYVNVAERVQHLVDLGINCVELMPITEFPWDFSMGYNPVSMWAPEWKFGTPNDLKYMIDTLHTNGIAVILDNVWNHVSPSDNYLWNYDGTQIYFDTPVVDTSWGAQADLDRSEVRDYYIQSVPLWLEEYRMDGFRMDATSFMTLQAGGWSLMQWQNDLMDNRYVDKVNIAEQLPNDPWVTRPTSLGGAGFDSQWHDYFVDSLRSEIFDAAVGNPEMWKIADILDGSGQYLSNVQVMNYFELHDEAAPASGGQRVVKTIDTTFPHDDIYAKGRVKLAQGLVLFAPGIPAFLMGSEFLEDTDVDGGSPSGTGRLDWSKKTTYANIFKYFQDVIATRKENGALKADSPIQVFHVNETGNVIAFQRYDFSGNIIVVIANFSNSDYSNYQIGLPQAGTWYELINSQASDYDGNGLGNAGSVVTNGGAYDGFGQSAFFTVPQMGLLVFRFNDAPGEECPGDLDGSGAIGPQDLALLLSAWGSTTGGPNWNPLADLDESGDVGPQDLANLLALWGTSCP